MSEEYTIVQKPPPKPRPDYYIKVPAIKAQVRSNWSTVWSEDLLEYIKHMYKEMNVEIPSDSNGEYTYLPKCIKTGKIFHSKFLYNDKNEYDLNYHGYSAVLEEGNEFELVPVKIDN